MTDDDDVVPVHRQLALADALPAIVGVAGARRARRVHAGTRALRAGAARRLPAPSPVAPALVAAA